MWDGPFIHRTRWDSQANEAALPVPLPYGNGLTEDARHRILLG